MPTNQVTTLSPDSIESFRKWLLARGRSAHTAKSYASDLAVLLSEVGESSIPFSELEEHGFEWLTEHRSELSPKTTGRRLTSLRTFSRYIGQGDLFLDYKAPTPLPSMPKPLPGGMDDLNAMLNRAEYVDLQVLTALCGLAGLRISEALALPPNKVDFQGKGLYVRGKGDKDRWVPMGERLSNILIGPVIKSMGQPTILTMQDRPARRSLTRLARRAGIGINVSSHMLRATFATALLHRGTDIRTIQELLGHSNVQTTQLYTGVTQKRMRDAVEDL